MPRTRSAPLLLHSILNIEKQRFSKLGDVVRKAEEHAETTAIVRSVLDPKLAKHCIAVTITGNRLTIFVDAAAWATRIRMCSPILLEELHELRDFTEVSKVVVKTMLSLKTYPYSSLVRVEHRGTDTVS